MSDPENFKNDLSSSETREQADFLDPISPERLQQMVDEFSEELGIDLSPISVKVVRPGDLSFDFMEILSKFQGKYGIKKVIPQFLTHGIDLTKPFEQTEENIQKMRGAATAEGFSLDGILTGFVYNTGGNIIYTAIRTDQMQKLAETYSQKEHEAQNFPTVDSARQYLEKLAEKYFYHEIGHSVLRNMNIDKTDLQAWSDLIKSNTTIQQEIIELQKDKFPSTDRTAFIPIILHESFAEIFSRVATHGRADARVSSHPKEEELMAVMLKKIGCKL